MSVNPDRKKKQVLLASVGGAVIVVGLYAISQITRVDQTILGASNNTPVVTSMIAGKTDGASPEMSWITNGREQMERMSAQLEHLSKALEIREREESKKIAEVTASYDDLMIKQQAAIEELRATVQAGSSRRTVRQTAANSGGVLPSGEIFTNAAARGPLSLKNGLLADGAGNPGSQAESQTSFNPPAPLAPLKRSFALAARPEATQAADTRVLLKNYLPAGSYAPALVLSGVDASTGVTNAAEPVPVLLRITGPAVTAGERSTRGRKIDLTGCTVTGSARGDLSSERVYVRLLKMACIKPGGEVFETDVAGYMSGAGKTGVRGLVVSREGKLVRNAGIAGALAGLAGGVANVGKAGAGSETASLSQTLQSAGGTAVGGGVESAATQLSEYYIERAEQYQPVVSLYGGTQVEVVFLNGVELD